MGVRAIVGNKKWWAFIGQGGKSKRAWKWKWPRNMKGKGNQKEGGRKRDWRKEESKKRRGEIEELEHRENIGRLRIITEQETSIPYLSIQKNCNSIKEQVSKINSWKLYRIVQIWVRDLNKRNNKEV